MNGSAESRPVSTIDRTKRMRAAFYNAHGEPEKLQIGHRPKPRPVPGKLLIKNYAAAVGAWDVGVMASGFGDPPLPMIPGCEVAGVVEAVSDGSDLEPSDLKLGDEVYGCLGFASGGFAEYSIAAPDHLAHKPERVSFEQAAALVVGAGTAYEGLIDRARLRPGEAVLITAAAGGVGTAAVQIAAAVGARVLGVASARNHDYIRGLGASETFDYHDPEWVPRLKQAVPDGVDVLFDGAGNQTRDRAIAVVKDGGRGVFIVGAPTDLRPDIQAHLFSADVTRDRLEAINQLVQERKLAAHIEAELPLKQAREAMTHVARGHTRGRVVLKIR
jgi:NADPH2:quinone reductase